MTRYTLIFLLQVKWLIKIASMRFLLFLATVTLAVQAQSQPAATDSIPTDSIDLDDIFLHHLDLSEIIVTGSTGNTRLKDASSAISMISAREMFAVSASNVINYVATLPGVSQVTTGGAIAKPVIRGLGYNRIVVVNDGIRQEGQQWGDEHGIEIDGNGVASVEVLKGPASLVYGSDALAGVIKFNSTPVSRPGTMHGEVATEYQTNNGLFAYSLNFGGNKGGNIWDLRYSDKWAHAYRNARDGWVPGSQFSERAARLMSGMNRNWGHAWLTFSYFGQQPSIVEGERDATTGKLVQGEGSATKYSHGMPYQVIHHYKIVSDNRFHIGDAGTLNAVLGYQQNQRKEFDDEENADDYGLFLKLHTLNYNINFNSKENDGFTFTGGAGGMWQKSLNKGTEFLIPDYRLFDFGVFATAQKRWERWSVNGGARWDIRHLNSFALNDDEEQRFEAFSRNFSGFTASAGAVFNVTDNFRLKANLARGFRAPNISELASNGEHEGALRYEQGSRELKPEFSLQSDLGLDYSNEWMSLQLSLFLNRLSNYIYLERVGETLIDGKPLYRYKQGSARLLGGEFSVDFHPIHSLHLSTAFSIVDARRLGQPLESRYLPFTPAPRWFTEVKWEITHSSHSTLLNNAYIAASVDYNFKQSHFLMAGNTESATDAYCLLNLQAGTDINVKGRRIATLAVIADNITGTVYQNHLSRLKYADVNAVTGRQGVFNMGTNVTIKLTIPLFQQ